MKKAIALTLSAFALFLAWTVHVNAQAPSVSVSVTDDTGIAMLVRYVGSNTSATVAVAAGGDLTFQVGGAAYTGFKCPGGGSNGVIDVSDPACDTMGKLVDIVNASGSDFRAVLIDSLRADSSDNTIVTIGATQVTRTDGLPLNIDTDVALLDSRALVSNRTNIAGYLGGKLLSDKEIKILASLPSREVLLTKIAVMLNMPMQRVATVLNAPIQKLAGVLKSLEQEKAKAA